MKIYSIEIIVTDDDGQEPESIMFQDGKWAYEQPKYPRQLEALIQIWRILKVVFVESGSIKDLK